jgi:hypothetical protein
MINTLGLLAGAIFRLFRSRRSLLLENLTLRQQLTVPETQTSPAEDSSVRQADLGRGAKDLVRMEEGSNRGQPGEFVGTEPSAGSAFLKLFET